MSYSVQWNLWAWEGKSWRVQSAHESQADAQQVIDDCGEHPNLFTIAKNGTPKDRYMRDNVTVRNAPQNYVRFVSAPYEESGPLVFDKPDEKTADHTARGSYDT